MEPNADPNTQHCKFMKSKKTILKTFEIPFPPRNQSRKIQSVCITKSTKLQSDKNFRMTIFTKKAKDNTYQTIWPENPKCEPKRTILYFVKVPYNFMKNPVPAAKFQLKKNDKVFILNSDFPANCTIENRIISKRIKI